MTILFLIGSLELGGAEKQMAILIEQLIAHGVECHLFALEPKGPLYDALKDIGLKIYGGGYDKREKHLKKGLLLFRSQFRLIQAILKIRPRVIHAYLPLTSFMGCVAGRLLQIPIIITSRRALGTHQDRYWGWRTFDMLSFRLSHFVTANSRAVARDSLKRDLGDVSKLSIIYNGINACPFESAKSHRDDIRSTLGISAFEKVVISIANLIPYKGLPVLIEAASRVITRRPEVKFLLIGEDRGILAQLKSKARSLGIEQQIVFLGQRLDVPELLAAADVLALCSNEEGFSNVILEAMASGLPVVATDVGGNGEAVLNGVTGWLVPPRNPDALADKILDLLENERRAMSFGKRGQYRVKESFTIEKMVKAYEDLYQSGLRRKTHHLELS